MTADIKQCPVCSSADVVSINDQFYTCKHCSIAFNTAYSQKLYNDNYFLDEYRNQYGKTYIEDFKNIYSLSSKRLTSIFCYLPNNKNTSDLSLLDIGSATGFFMKCARKAGINNVTGIEISEYASHYCKEHFNIPVIQKSFDDVTLTSFFNIITAWYFIEHSGDPVSVIQKIYDALSAGGIFAFSVPSIFGPLYTFKRDEWIQTHPSDHYMDFSPGAIKKILKQKGFKKVFVKPAGIHPERIIDPHSFLYRPIAIIYRLFSRLTSFSDTIEVFAIK